MLDALKTALTSTGYPAAHFAWSTAPSGTYLVYAEDGANALRANGKTVEAVLTGTVDCYTRDDSDLPRTTVETALNTCNIAWYLNSIQFEQDSGYIHYEWVFEAVA